MVTIFHLSFWGWRIFLLQENSGRAHQRDTVFISSKSVNKFHHLLLLQDLKSLQCRTLVTICRQKGVHISIYFNHQIFILCLKESREGQRRDAFPKAVKPHCHVFPERSSPVDIPVFSVLCNLLCVFAGKQSKREKEVHQVLVNEAYKFPGH